MTPYWLWVNWRLGEGPFKGKGPCSKPRPSVLPLPIPLLWWVKLALFLARRKAATQPAPPDPLAFWRSTGVWESWGLGNGQFTPERLCSIAKARGCQWIGVQDSAADRQKRDEIKQACQTYGLKLAIWEWATTVDDALSLIDFWKPDAYVANVEHDPGTWDTFARVVAEKHPSLPRAVFTNFWGAGATQDGYSVAEGKVWWGRGFACITEAYMVNEHGTQLSLSPSNLDWTAKTHLGYPETFPCFGIYRVGPEYYDGWAKSWPNHSWYLAEYLPEAR